MAPRTCSHRRVAVLIPAKDAATTIGRAVRSALAQPEAVEVVVVDDGSTDATAQVARDCDDGSGRLQVLSQPHRGPSAAINRAQNASRAEYLCVLDADDFFLDGRLAAIFSGAGEGWDMAADRLLLAREGFEDGPYERWAGVIPASGSLEFAEFVTGNITDPARPRTELGYLQPVIRRAFLEEAALQHDETVRLGEDYLLYAQVLARGGVFRVVEDFRYVAVARAQSLSHSHRSDDLADLLRADRALARLVSSPTDRTAVRLHVAHVHNKWIYHRALDAKADGKVLQAVMCVATHPGAWWFVITQTLRARLAAGRRTGSARREVTEPHAPQAEPAALGQ